MGSAQSLWQDKSTLYELYHREELDKMEISERLGCSDVTVGNWMDRLGVPSVRAYERESYLRSLYVDKRMTQSEIADLFKCCQTTIGRALDEHGIETRDSGDYALPSVYFSQSGYLTCRHRHGKGRSERVAFRIHRLVAVAEFGFDAVVGCDVHHKNKHRADNRHENLEVMERSEHTEHHHEREDILVSYPS